MMQKEKGCETMTARDLIVMADEIRKTQGMTQAEWSREAGFDNNGMAISRTYKRGNCKLTTMVQMLRPLGYVLEIKKLEDMP